MFPESGPSSPSFFRFSWPDVYFQWLCVATNSSSLGWLRKHGGLANLFYLPIFPQVDQKLLPISQQGFAKCPQNKSGVLHTTFWSIHPEKTCKVLTQKTPASQCLDSWDHQAPRTIPGPEIARKINKYLLRNSPKFSVTKERRAERSQSPDTLIDQLVIHILIGLWRL